MSTGYIGATIPANIVRVSGTTLFHIAMLNSPTNDPLQWVAIAELNGLINPWVDAQANILIPPVFPPEPQDGILGL
jgi:hypothetical protein